MGEPASRFFLKQKTEPEIKSCLLSGRDDAAIVGELYEPYECSMQNVDF